MVCDILIIDPIVWKALLTRGQQPENCNTINDIHSGRIYRNLKINRKEYVTLVVNTDGVQVFKSSTVSMWPIWVVINELPINMR